MDKNDKIVLGICGVIVVGGLILGGYCFSRAQYYQGRIDARNEMNNVFLNILNDLKKSKVEKEA